MDKRQFLTQLRKALAGLPQSDIEERLSFYSEMIDDRMEEGLSEQEAVAAVGSVEEIISQTIGDIPLAKLTKERVKSNRQRKIWEIILLVLGSPIWLSLGIAAVAVTFSLYISFWSVIISLWAVFASLTGCFIGGLAAGIVITCTGNALAGMAVLAAGLICAGFSIFAFYGCSAVTRGFILLTRKTAGWIKNCFVK